MIVELEIGVISNDNLNSLLSRGYSFNAVPIDDDLLEAGLAIVTTSLRLDQKDVRQRQASIDDLHAELGFAQYHSLQHVLVPGPGATIDVTIYARTIAAALIAYPFLHLSIHLPLSTHLDLSTNGDVPAADDSDPRGTWEIWDTIRSVCAYNPRLHIALDVSDELPTSTRMSEPIKILLLSARVFLLNQKGYPVLPKAHQQLIQTVSHVKPSIVLQDIDHFHRLGGEDAYMQYIKHILRNVPELPAAEVFAAGYQDYLQQPLQPLMDNLMSATYEIFERDPVKYAQYEKALVTALTDRPRGANTVVAVVGAGRGPLVDCALRASEESDTPIVLYAIEKNPHAIIGLQRRIREDWGNKVSLIHTDMREWQPDGWIDILVSELLGSFGDNELSPECIDGVQHVLNPKTGISIPCEYTPFVTPLMTPKIWSNLKTQHDPAAFETPYVVLLSQCDYLSTDFLPLWSFDHPTSQSGSQKERQMRNKRYGNVRFKITKKGVCHGVAGYFEAVLYGDIGLSTVPDTIDQKSPDMVSWFPIFFPLKAPIFCPEGSIMEMHFWRETDAKKVWYEYMVELSVGKEKVCVSELHNLGGVKNWIGL